MMERLNPIIPDGFSLIRFKRPFNPLERMCYYGLEADGMPKREQEVRKIDERLIKSEKIHVDNRMGKQGEFLRYALH